VGVLFVATGVGSGTGTATSRNTGNYNVASGYRSLYYNTTGYWNTASGFASLYLNTTGAKNAASGSSSLYWNTTGSSNTASGFASLYNNTTGHSNTANGYESLHYNLTGHHNTASGLYSLRYNTTGSYNTASGYKSLHNSGKIVTAGSFVVGVAYTIQSVGTTDFTAIGASANTVGVVFTATGVGSGTGTASSNSGSSNNTALGHAAGANITTGSSNIIIGANVEAPSATGDNQLNIGNTIYGDTSTGNVEINGSIKISDDTRTASAAGEGTLRWNAGKLQNSTGTDWKEVNDLTWGSIQWDHNSNVGLTNTGFSLRPSGSNGWHSGVYLLTPFNGDVLVEFTAERHSDPHHGMLGFSTNVPTSVTYTEAEYRWYADHGTTSLHGQSTQYNTSYGPSDVFKMERVGGTLKWYFNDTEVHGVNYSGPLYLHAGLYTNNQSIHITKIIGVLG